MAQRDAEYIPQGSTRPLFRPLGNSPSARHLTHMLLLCWVSLIIADLRANGKGFFYFYRKVRKKAKKTRRSQKINTISVVKTVAVWYNIFILYPLFGE